MSGFIVGSEDDLNGDRIPDAHEPSLGVAFETRSRLGSLVALPVRCQAPIRCEKRASTRRRTRLSHPLTWGNVGSLARTLYPLRWLYLR